MRKNVKLLVFVVMILTLTIVLMTSCSESGLTNPEVSENQGIPASEIRFLEWSPNVIENMKSLNKTVVSEKVFTQAGGELATSDMFGCKLTIPANAFNDTERLIQAHILSDDGNLASIDFLPSQQFTKNVSIVLPFSALKIEDDEVSKLRAFWFNEETNLWVEIPEVDIDEANQQATAKIDHFTRFGWGF